MFKMWLKLLVISVLFTCVLGFLPEYHDNSEEIEIPRTTVKYSSIENNVYYNIETSVVYKYQTDISNDLKELYNSSEKDNERSEHEAVAPFQPWSILWYAGSFGGLIAFFLVVSCSEWCCRAHARNTTSGSLGSGTTQSETPPPAYDLFAPPPYESLHNPDEKTDYDVFVVPVESLLESSVSQTVGLNPRSHLFMNSSRNGSDLNEVVIINVASVENDCARQKEVKESATQT